MAPARHLLDGGDYVRPTPTDGKLEVRARVEEIKGRKIIVASELKSGGRVCAKGRVVAVMVPDTGRKPTTIESFSYTRPGSLIALPDANWYS
jgi:acyl-CoA thioesterase FadM